MSKPTLSVKDLAVSSLSYCYDHVPQLMVFLLYSWQELRRSDGKPQSESLPRLPGSKAGPLSDWNLQQAASADVRALL